MRGPSDELLRLDDRSPLWSHLFAVSPISIGRLRVFAFSFRGNLKVGRPAPPMNTDTSQSASLLALAKASCAAVGMASLPMSIAVEIEMVVEVE